MDGWIAAFIAAVGAMIAYLQWRESQKQARVRLDQVHEWANDAIAQLQTILLATVHAPPLQSDEECLQRMKHAAFALPVLVERGRLFFKNEVTDTYGAEKPAAYRGYRPKILDPLVLAYQAVCGWNGASLENKCKIRKVIKNCLEEFVTLSQIEVGRSVTASPDTTIGGQGVNLNDYLNRIRLEEGEAEAVPAPGRAGH